MLLSCWMKTLCRAASWNGISALKQKQRRHRRQELLIHFLKGHRVVQHRWQQPLQQHNAFNPCPWFGQSCISLDNVILSLDNVMTFLISSPILDNVAWFWLLTPDYGQFCTFYIHIPKHNGQFRTFCKQSKKSINPSHGNLPLDARKLIFFWNCMNFNWNST